MSDKQVVLDVVQQLPETISLEEIQEELAILASIRKAEAEIVAGKVIPHEEVVKRSASWITK